MARIQDRGRAATPIGQLRQERAEWQTAGRCVALTNGCFDLLHPGHIGLLEAARSLADILIVALNSDRSVGEIKGAGRPLIPQQERAEALLALEPVDRVAIYDEPTPIEVIRALEPDVLVKGADWGLDHIVGRNEVEARGGRVVRIDLLPGRSTTALLQRIRHS